MLSIAVIIPVGPGHEHHARRAVLSVRRQSVPAMPLLVNDSGINRRLASGAIEVQTRGAQGVGYARALGTISAERLRYDMVCYLDADDILMPRALEAMIRTYVARPASYVYGDGYNLRGGVATYYRAAEYDRAIYGRQNIHNVTALMPTSVALAGEWTNRHWEDYLFYCSLALRGLCGVRAPYPVIAYDLAAGYRREMATNEGSGYARGLAAEYQTKFLANGGATMGCCGSSGPLATSAAAMVEAAPGVAQPDGTVAMAYSGDAAAAVPYRVHGREYRAKIGSVIYAHPDDVDWLKRIGVFYEVPITPDGDETIKLAEEYNALVLGTPPGALEFKPLELSDSDREFIAGRDQLQADINNLFAGDPLTVDAAGNVLAQVDRPDPKDFIGDAALDYDGDGNIVAWQGDAEPDASGAGAPPADAEPAATDSSAEDDGEPDEDKPAKPRRGRKAKSDQK